MEWMVFDFDVDNIVSAYKMKLINFDKAVELIKNIYRRKKEVMNMECLYLVKCGKSGICNASLSSMVPGAFERQVYCDTEEHYRCPILIAHTLRKGSREEVVRAGMLCSR